MYNLHACVCCKENTVFPSFPRKVSICITKKNKKKRKTLQKKSGFRLCTYILVYIYAYTNHILKL